MRHCGSKESGEVNKKRQGIPITINKEKGTLKSPGEGYTGIILVIEIDFFLGSREAWKKSEGISGKYGKYTTHHGAPQARIRSRNQIFCHTRTIGKKYSGKLLGVIRRGSYQ